MKERSVCLPSAVCKCLIGCASEPNSHSVTRCLMVYSDCTAFDQIVGVVQSII